MVGARLGKRLEVWEQTILLQTSSSVGVCVCFFICSVGVLIVFVGSLVLLLNHKTSTSEIGSHVTAVHRSKRALVTSRAYPNQTDLAHRATSKYMSSG